MSASSSASSDNNYQQIHQRNEEIITTLNSLAHINKAVKVQYKPGEQGKLGTYAIDAFYTTQGATGIAGQAIGLLFQGLGRSALNLVRETSQSFKLTCDGLSTLEDNISELLNSFNQLDPKTIHPQELDKMEKEISSLILKMKSANLGVNNITDVYSYKKGDEKTRISDISNRFTNLIIEAEKVKDQISTIRKTSDDEHREVQNTLASLGKFHQVDIVFDPSLKQFRSLQSSTNKELTEDDFVDLMEPATPPKDLHETTSSAVSQSSLASAAWSAGSHVVGKASEIISSAASAAIVYSQQDHEGVIEGFYSLRPNIQGICKRAKSYEYQSQKELENEITALESLKKHIQNAQGSLKEIHDFYIASDSRISQSIDDLSVDALIQSVNNALVELYPKRNQFQSSSSSSADASVSAPMASEDIASVPVGQAPPPPPPPPPPVGAGPAGGPPPPPPPPGSILRGPTKPKSPTTEEKVAAAEQKIANLQSKVTELEASKSTNQQELETIRIEMRDNQLASRSNRTQGEEVRAKLGRANLQQASAYERALLSNASEILSNKSLLEQRQLVINEYTNNMEQGKYQIRVNGISTEVTPEAMQNAITTLETRQREDTARQEQLENDRMGFEEKQAAFKALPIGDQTVETLLNALKEIEGGAKSIDTRSKELEQLKSICETRNMELGKEIGRYQNNIRVLRNDINKLKGQAIAVEEDEISVSSTQKKDAQSMGSVAGAAAQARQAQVLKKLAQGGNVDPDTLL